MPRLLFAAAAGLLVLASGCGGPPPQRLNAGGSTSVHPLMSLWTHEYDRRRAVQVNYQPIGSGGGIRQLTAGPFAFGCTDTPMDDEQLQEARAAGGEVLHVPLVLGAVVPAYNLPQVHQPLRFSGPVLADVYLGRITRWNDPALRELNPDTPLPDQDILVVHRSDSSGTTSIWVDYLCRVSPRWKEQVGAGAAVRWPAGMGQKGGEGVAGQVLRCPGSIGYLELTYALENDISLGLVRNREGHFIRASLDSVRAAADSLGGDVPDDLRYSLTDAPGASSYPISGTTWAILFARQPAQKGRLLVDFLRWLIHDGQQLCAQRHYVGLPASLQQRADQMLDRTLVGG